MTYATHSAQFFSMPIAASGVRWHAHSPGTTPGQRLGDAIMSTINVISAPNASDADAATYTLNVAQPYSSASTDLSQNIVFSDGVLKITGLAGNSDDFQYEQGPQGSNILAIGGAGGTAFETSFLDESPDQGTHLQVSRLGDVVYVTEGTLHLPAGATPIQGYAVPPTPPAPPPGITRAPTTIFDTTTNAYVNDNFSHPYTGPVAGIGYEMADITPDSLNVTANSYNMFIATGSGNDAVALAGGTNVVDAGTGSNFITCVPGGGQDTVFLDARNIPASTSAAGPVPGAIWDTIANLHSGDAATLWGVSPGTALSWQKNEGAVGHTGLTLHANMPNGSEASLTLAGIDSKAGLQLSYGSSDGSSYLYLKSA